MPKQETQEEREIGKPKPKPVAQPAPEKAPALSFLQKVGQLGYPYADVLSKVVVVDNPDAKLLSLGFQDLNGRCQVVMTGEVEKWRKVFEDALEYIGDVEPSKK